MFNFNFDVDRYCNGNYESNEVHEMSMAKMINIYTAFTLAYLQAVAGMFRTGVE